MNSGHNGLIRAVDIDPSESPKYYVTGSDDATLRIWSTKKINDPTSNSKHYQTLLKGGHQMPVTDVLINHVHPNEVFSASDDKLALKWDLNTRTVTNQFLVTLQVSPALICIKPYQISCLPEARIKQAECGIVEPRIKVS